MLHDLTRNWQADQEILEANPKDKILAKLCETHDQARAQHDSSESMTSAHPSSCNSLPPTPATETFDAFGGTVPTTRPASAAPADRAATDELLRLKLELAKAQNHISRVEQELAQTRRDCVESGRATPILSSDSDFTGGAPLIDPIGTKGPGNPSMPGFIKPQLPLTRDTNWQAPIPDDCRSDISDAVSATGYNRSRGIWNNGIKPVGYQNSFVPTPMPMQEAIPAGNWPHSRNQGFVDQGMPSYSAPPMDNYRGDRYNQEPDLMRSGSGRRNSRYDNRFGGQSYGSGYGGYTNMGGIGGGMGSGMGQNQYESAANYPSGGPNNMSGGGMGMFPQYGQPQVGTPLSPHATEFTSVAGSSWKPEVSHHPARIHCCHASFAVAHIVFLDHCHGGTDLFADHRATKLPASLGPQRQLQLEVHR